MEAGEARLFAATLLVASIFAVPLRDSSTNATLVATENLARGHLSLVEGAETVGDRAWVPTRLSAASLALPTVVPVDALRGGRAYSGSAPGLAFLCLPVYLVARLVFSARGVLLVVVLVLASLPHALGTVAMRRAIRGAGSSEAAADLAALAYGGGTIALPLATRLMPHSAVLALVAGALALLLGQRPRPALAGALGSVALACHYGAGIACLGLGALAFARMGLRGAVACALGAAPVLLALAVYHMACFGSPFATGYDFRVQPDIQDLILEGRYGFSLPRAWVLGELVFGVRRGVLFTEPVLFVGALGLVLAARRDRVAAIALATALLVLLTNGGRVRDWSAGLSFGSRYLSPAIPFLALGFPRGFEATGIAGRVSLAASVALALVASATNWGYSVLTTLDTLFELGPRALGVVSLLGHGDQETTGAAALVSALAVSLALPAAAAIRATPRTKAAWIVLGALALVPWLAVVRFEWTRSSGPEAVARLDEGLRRREMLLELGDTWHPRQARRMAQSAATVRDPVVYARAVERIVTLDPGDRAAREELERLRALGR